MIPHLNNESIDGAENVEKWSCRRILCGSDCSRNQIVRSVHRIRHLVKSCKNWKSIISPMVTFSQCKTRKRFIHFVLGLLKWLLPYYSNLRILINKPIHQLSMVLNEVCYLRNLRQLKVNVDRPNDLSEVAS